MKNCAGIEHRVAKVSFVTGLTTILSVGFQLVSVPICLKYWGKETYGNWLTLLSAFLLLRSLDGGFVSYVGNKLNCLYHQNRNAMREHLASAIAGIAIIASIQLAIVVAVFLSDSVASLLGVTTGSSVLYQSRVGLLLLIGTWVLSGSYLGIVHRLMIPTGLMYQSAWWSMAFQVSQFAGIILAALLHFNMLQTSLLFAFFQFSIYVGSAIYIKSKLPDYYPWWRGIRVRTGLKDLGNSMWLTTSNLIQQGASNGVVILISALSGPASVPVFTTVRTLANLWTNVTNVLTTPLLPDVVRYHSKGEGTKLVLVNNAYWVLVGSAVNIGVLITYPLISYMYASWTSHAVALDESLLCMLLSSVVIANVGGLMSLYLNGTNRLGVVLATSVERGVIGLVLGGFLSFHFGLTGFGIAILGGEVIALLTMGYYFVRQELTRNPQMIPGFSPIPIVISTASVLLFLSIVGFGYSHSIRVYPVALLGVSAAAWWGWSGLATDIKSRIKGVVLGG